MRMREVAGTVRERRMVQLERAGGWGAVSVSADGRGGGRRTGG